MSFKFIATQVISEPKFSMIINRTLQPSYRSLKNHTIGRKLAPTTQTLCYSLALSGQVAAQLSRSYSAYFFPDSRSSKKDDNYSTRPASDVVDTYLKSLNGQARKTGGSLKKFEPCYRPLYPSKKNPKPTYKIPRKLPYIPAVFQSRRKLGHHNKRPSPQKHPVLNQWPTLYRCKKRDSEQKPTVTRPKTGDLPPWLLPLYSCKAGRPDDIARLAEARFSGGAFHRRMEILEGINEIRQKQAALRGRLNEGITKKAVNNYKPQPFISKNAAAVNNLKRMIGEMYAKRGTLKHSESYQRTQQIMKESETVENHSEAISDDKTKTHAPSSSSNQGVMSKVTSYSTKRSTNLNEVDPPVKPSQFSSEMQGTYKSVSESKSVISPRRMESSTGPRKKGSIDQTTINKENNATDSNEWSVQSLKLRINDMLANEGEKLNKITSKYNDLVGVKKYNSDGLRRKGNQPSTRSFHQSSLKPNESKINYVSSRGIATHSINGGLQLQRNSGGSYIGKRSLSAFSSLKGVERPTTNILSSYMAPNNKKELPVKKTKWITRVKRCFVIKKNKGHKVDDWKQTPRKIPYCRKVENTLYSPSPVLWTPKENAVAKFQPDSPVERTNPVVLNAEQRIKASINRIVPTPGQNVHKEASECANHPVILDAEDKLKVASSISLAKQEALDRMTEVEKKVRKAELKVSIMPLPWPNEVKSIEKISKLPELSSSQNDNLSGVLTGIGKKEETGYEWIMNNKQIVEDIKDRSRQIAGKPLVPSHVKQSIEEFKLPLRAQIAQYRKSIERKARGLYFYSTSRRWYSTSCSMPRFPLPCHPHVFFHGDCQPRLLQRLNTCGISARSLTCGATQSNEYQSQRDQPKQNSRSEVSIGSDFYHKYALRPMYGDFSRDEPLNRLAKDPKYSKSWTNVTEKALPPRPVGTLTSPNKMIHKIGDTSPAALKKQVEDLKRLIRKSKGLDFVPEKVEEVAEPPQSSDCYESKLRKLIRAAQANAKKVKVVEPKYQNENNLLNNASSVERKFIPPQPQKVEPIKSRLKNSSTPNFFANLGNDSRIDRTSLKTKPQISRSVSVDSFPRKKTPFSNVYLKLKSFVESVRRKSTQETQSRARIIPNDKLRGSISVGALANIGKIKDEAKVVKVDNVPLVNEAKGNSLSTTPLTVELRGGHAITPASSIQLWKTEPHGESDVPTPAVVGNAKTTAGGETSKPGDLSSLLTRAKELLNIQSALNDEEYSKFSKLVNSNMSFFPITEAKNTPCQLATIDNSTKRILSPEEIMQSLLTKPETLKMTTSKIEQIDAKLSENKTKFWPVMSFLPQNVFGKMDEVGCKEESSANHQDNEKSSDFVPSSLSVQLPDDCPKTDVLSPSVQCSQETQEVKTCSIHKKPEGTNETHIVPVTVDLETQELNPVSLSSETTPFTSQASDSAPSLSNASTSTSYVEPEEGLAQKELSEVDHQPLQCNDSKALVAGNINQTTLESHVHQSESSFHSGDCKDQGVFSQNAKVVTADDASTFESSHLEKSDPSSVSHERWESFSKNLKNVLARHAAEFKRCERDLPESPKEMDACNESAEKVGSIPQLDHNNDSSTSETLELEHDGIANFDRHQNSYLDSDFQESELSSSPSNHNTELIDCSGISSSVVCSMPNELTNVNDVTAEEAEEKVDALCINQVTCHECQKIAELLAKDPTINPGISEKIETACSIFRRYQREVVVHTISK
uniref:Uncharacterized protein n=1 Tax=Lygus hesperus TaxID=30085 RepID=A0A0K8SW45_LYGHE